MSADDIAKSISGARPAHSQRRTRRKRSQILEIDAAIAAINKKHALVLTGGRCLVLRETLSAERKLEIEFLGSPDFRLWHSQDKYWNGGPRPEPIGSIWLSHPNRRNFIGIAFAPEGAPEGYYNLWHGFDVEPRYADPYKAFPVFYDHIQTNIAKGDEALALYVWGWFAHMFQRPTERLGTSLVLRGNEGTGKTKVGEVIGSLISRHYLLVDDPRYITGQFNAHLANCLLLQADEGFWAGDRQAEGRLKSLVTSHRHMIERKGVDPVPVRNLVRLLVTSNNDWVVPVGMQGRRFVVVDVGEAAVQNAEYFGAIDAEMDNGGREALLYHLLNFDLTKVNLRRIPVTSALIEQKVSSLEPHAQWWLDRLRHGAPTANHTHWPERVSTDQMYSSYLQFADRMGVHRKMSPEQFGIALRKLMPAGGLALTRPWENVTDPETAVVSRKRVNCYLLPSLSECRETFAQLMKWTIDWTDEEPD